MRKNNCIPGLEKVVGQRLGEWRNNQPFQQIRHQDDRILHIIQSMDNIGWKHLGFGLIPQQWTQYQTQHLKNSNSKLSGVHWMSKFIRQIWKLHKKMWLDRNSYVHRGGKSIHKVEEDAIHNAIRQEFERGRDELPGGFTDDFNGSVSKIVDGKDIIRKQQWLASIWYARDFLRRSQDLDPEERDPVAQAFITRFHLRRKRKRALIPP